MKNKIIKIAAGLFATFLIFATLETIFLTPDSTAKTTEESATLEVPVTGRVGNQRTSETYETLIEISILALVGTGFYIVNMEKR
jgi:hypothetical protein